MPAGKAAATAARIKKTCPSIPTSWSASTGMSRKKWRPPDRDVLRDRLAHSDAGEACPFLIDKACSIHPVRPIGCRQFNVFTAPCAPGEDPFYTRRDDVLMPVADYTDRAFAAVLPFYGLKREGAAEAIKLVRSQIMNLRSFDWSKLVAIMDKSGPRKP